MRKHFLLLFLMALLPLAGWAETKEVTIQCANITFYYGANDIPENGSGATVDMIGIMQAPAGVTKAEVAAALTFERVGSTSTAVNAEGYLYRLVKKTGYDGDLDVAVTGGNGTLYINKRPVTLTATDAEKDYGAQNPTFAATETPAADSSGTLRISALAALSSSMLAIPEAASATPPAVLYHQPLLPLVAAALFQQPRAVLIL